VISTFSTSKPFFIEVNDKGISKGNSLDALCKKLGLTKDNVMALGDGLNDLSMIEFAGMGVAVDNANPVLKEAADFISKSNDEDGFAYAIENNTTPIVTIEQGTEALKLAKIIIDKIHN